MTEILKSITTIKGDKLDMLCRLVYGSEKDKSQIVLDFNQGLAEHVRSGMPAGINIDFPVIEDNSSETKLVQLYD